MGRGRIEECFRAGLRALKYLRVAGVRGFLAAIRAKATHSTAVVEIRRHDCKYPLRLRVPSSDIGIYRQVFLREEYKFAAEIEPEVIVDAGANIGLASIYFANKYPHARIVAIEPEASNFEL